MDAPAIILLTASVVSILAFKPVARAIKWVFSRNVGQPFAAWFKHANETTTRAVVREVVQTELKERNGGASLRDIADKQDEQAMQLNHVATAQVMHSQRLQELARQVAEVRKTQADVARQLEDKENP